MAILSPNSNSWVFSLKVLLISIGILSMAMILKLSVPVVLEFIVSEVPVIWRSLLSWLTPPYLYIVINGIIITIAASSRFQQKLDEQQSESMVPVKIPADVRSDFALSAGYDAVTLKNQVDVQTEFEILKPMVEYVQMETTVSEVKTMVTSSENEEDDFEISRSSWTPLSRRDSTEIPTEYSFLTEKPLVSSRFGHRKTVKASPEGGKALRVAKPKRHDTLESTWKTITDGRPIPLARHLKKSDTWETHGRYHNNAVGLQESSPSPLKMKKAETFKDRNNAPSSLSPSPGSGKLRKEPSLSQDELNRRVEAFIKKFNEEMRLQRQESLNQYKEMVNRGTNK